MNFQGDFIYVIREREFINSGDDIYRVGRSGNISQRMANHPKGSSLRLILKVGNAVQAKHEVLSRLNTCKYLVNCTDIGEDYFQGNLDTIISIVTQVAAMSHGGDTDGEEEDEDEDDDEEEEDIGEEDTENDDTEVEENDEEEEEGGGGDEDFNVVTKFSMKRKRV
jgi:hypothetical protein